MAIGIAAGMPRRSSGTDSGTDNCRDDAQDTATDKLAAEADKQIEKLTAKQE